MVFLETLGYFGLLAAQWLIVFVINIIPALMPPTWAVLSFFYITTPQNIWVLVIIGVTASTSGRFVLAKLSGYVTSRFADKGKRREFEGMRKRLENRPIQKMLFAFIYALSPLPSNALFIAFGATKTRMREVLAGFFAGRTISYLFLVFTTQKVFSSFSATLEGNASLWTIMIEIIGVIAIMLFFAVDWNKIIMLQPPGMGKKKRK